MNIFQFGEKVDGYDILMLNEREIRAGAGILYFFATIAFFNAYLLSDFLFLKCFVTFFMFDFIIRVIVNPMYSPSLILGRIIVKNQTPEFSGAPQKRWAWSIGLVMSIFMFFYTVIFEQLSNFSLVLCSFCLFFLLFESAFGICVGCTLYNKFSKNQSQHCPGGACGLKIKYPIQTISKVQIFILLLFVIFSIMIIFINSKF